MLRRLGDPALDWKVVGVVAPERKPGDNSPVGDVAADRISGDNALGDVRERMESILPNVRRGTGDEAMDRDAGESSRGDGSLDRIDDRLVIDRNAGNRLGSARLACFFKAVKWRVLRSCNHFCTGNLCVAQQALMTFLCS